MNKIELGINQFIRMMDGRTLHKEADFFGGFYNMEDLPEGEVLQVIKTSTMDPVGRWVDHHPERVIFEGTSGEILRWAKDQPW
jgi:hypothetical protein